MQPNFSFAAARMPFRLEGGFSDTFAHAGWQQAQAATLDSLGRGEAVAVLGPPGIGKSLLLQSLVPLLQHEGRVARLVGHEDLLRQAAGTDVLLVDDAGMLNTGALTALCAMGVLFVLAVTGQLPALPRPVVQVQLPSLTAEEVARFVATRLAAAGRRRDLFEPEAILALARQSAGVLQRVSLIAGGAVSLAEVEGAPRVLRRHVDEAATGGGFDDVEAQAALPMPAKPVLPSAPMPAPKGAPDWRRIALLSAAGLGVVLTGSLAYSQWGSTAPAAQTSSLPPAASAPARVVPAAAAAEETEQERRDRRVLQALEADPLPGITVAPRRNEPAPRQQAPAPAPASIATMSFRGVVDNETIQQSGQMSLVITQRDPSGGVTARFRAWDGLLGTGELRGRLSDEGMLAVSGQLMVGQNPFMCDLSGRITGSTLTGSANFTRGGRVSHAVFKLARS